MKKRILTVILALLTVFSLLSPAFAIAGNSKIAASPFFYADHAGVLSNETESKIITANYALSNILNDAQITVITLKDWDGDEISEPAYSAMNELGFGYASDNIDMVIIFDIYEGNHSIFAGYGIQALFDDSTANMYLEEHFIDLYNKGDYDGAVISLITPLVDWYEANSLSILENLDNISSNQSTDKPDNYHRWYRSIPFIFLGAIISSAFFAFLSYLCKTAADKRRYFNSYYIKVGGQYPRFRIRDLWSGPHLDIKPYEVDFTYTCYLDVLAKVFRFLAELSLLFMAGGGRDSGNSDSSSGRGSGGGGHSGGGGAGRR